MDISIDSDVRKKYNTELEEKLSAAKWKALRRKLLLCLIALIVLGAIAGAYFIFDYYSS